MLLLVRTDHTVEAFLGCRSFCRIEADDGDAASRTAKVPRLSDPSRLYFLMLACNSAWRRDGPPRRKIRAG